MRIYIYWFTNTFIIYLIFLFALPFKYHYILAELSAEIGRNDSHCYSHYSSDVTARLLFMCICIYIYIYMYIHTIYINLSRINPHQSETLKPCHLGECKSRIDKSTTFLSQCSLHQHQSTKKTIAVDNPTLRNAK